MQTTPTTRIEKFAMIRSMRRQLRLRRARRHIPEEWGPPESGEAPRVLLEYPHGGSPSIVADIIERAGYQVRVCEGPDESSGVCHLLDTGECTLVCEADVVFNGFDLDCADHREILESLRHRYPDTPVIVETTEFVAEQHGDVLGDYQQCTGPLTSRGLLNALGSALETVDNDVATTGCGSAEDR